ncbi:uncharacterized protein L201_004156 [Kwoniella dendrophila CBS 6074]|uniref:Origin recognition complex subunit 3 winged helix C-terminal domain-containing protein n=1 Tax=Kwoniella dendrophila CBS 6074 TaxID=1295534 RepID=A0AAX4JWF2_9TREE
MEEEKYQSLSKGVFVVPFQADQDENEAGPSKLRTQPLQELYDLTYEHYERAYSDYSIERTAEQLDDISDWIDRCFDSPLLPLNNPIYRLELGLIQNASAELADQLHTLGNTISICNLHGRDLNDVNSALKIISTGFIGEINTIVKKTGRTGIEDIENWYKAKKNKTALLIYIQEAQIIPSSILGELMYIFSLHPSIPLRLLLSVPSITHFLSSWTPIESSSIALSVLSSTNNKRKNNAVEAILRSSDFAPIRLSDELADQMRIEEARSGGGPKLVLKAIKWLLLYHSINSSLAKLASTSDSHQLKRIQALVHAIINRPDDESLPGRELLQLDTNRNLTSVMNPAPRTSILHALSNSADYLPPISTPSERIKSIDRPQSTSPSPIKSASRKRKLNNETSEDDTRTSRRKSGREVAENLQVEDQVMSEAGYEGKGEELEELQMLFELWKSAGKSVNLWDWLEGFSGIMSYDDQAQKQQQGQAELNPEGQEDDSIQNSINSNGHDVNGNDTNVSNGVSADDDQRQKDIDNDNDNQDEENEARLHSIFIRFVEEARMIGLIRARGKGRKADEVVKGIGLV